LERLETIIVVDDEPAVRDVLIRTITSAGYNVLEASSKAEALRLIRSFSDPIHLAIIDHTLGDSRGADVAAEIAIIRPGIGVLLISGFVAKEDDLAGFPYLQKPFAAHVLFNKIRQLLGSTEAASG